LKTKLKTKIVLITALITIVVALTVYSNYAVNKATAQYISNNIALLPSTTVGVVLGTSKLLKNGNRNYYFTNRVTAAVELYKSGKINYIIISGDNGHKQYNEPEDFLDELVAQGIPDSVIYLDFAGFRTLDSVIRTWKIFKQSKFIVISQEFHNQRAVYIARYYGLDAYGYNAKEVGKRFGMRTKIREYFARNKMFIDLWCNKQPKFLGDVVTIGLKPNRATSH
jgi:SanA protein